jgi:hypothetical protein
MTDMNSQFLEALAQAMQEQNVALTNLVGSLSSRSTSALKTNPPAIFNGDIHKSNDFLTQLNLYLAGKAIDNADQKISIALSYMQGETVNPWVRRMALKLGTGLTWEDFMKEFKATYSDPNPKATAIHKMSLLEQGTHSVDEYVATFRSLQDDTGFNDPALLDYFKKGLNSSLVDNIYKLRPMPETLDDWVKEATALDRQWRQRQAEKKLKTSTPKPTTTTKPISPLVRFTQTDAPIITPPPTQAFKEPDVVPMEIDSGWKRVNPKICFKCRKPGHIARNCSSSVNINNMDYDTLKAHMKAELEKEASLSHKEDF